MLIDTHCHLAGLNTEEIAALLAEAKLNDVGHLVAIGSGYGFADNMITVNLCKQHSNISCALGMHPHEAATVTEEHFTLIKNEALQNKNVLAIGETGLDYHYMHSSKEAQQKVFTRFIHLAGEVQKPLIIHDRECGDDCVTFIKNEGGGKARGVVHCFSGDEALAKKYLDLDFMISFTGIITFKKADALRAVVKMVPLDKIMIETDSPFLAPLPFRGKKNQPAYVKYVAQQIAHIKEKSYDDIAAITTKNACRFFALTL